MCNYVDCELLVEFGEWSLQGAAYSSAVIVQARQEVDMSAHWVMAHAVGDKSAVK